jgi:hypothetical protein
MELSDLTCFFGWMTAINLVIFVIGFLKLSDVSAYGTDLRFL